MFTAKIAHSNGTARSIECISSFEKRSLKIPSRSQRSTFETTEAN